MKVIVFPLRNNPYQEYLYQSIEKHIGKINVIYFTDIDYSNKFAFVKYVLNWPFKLSQIKDRQKVFHLHWQFFYFLLNKKVRTLPSILLCLWILLWVKVFNFKIIWSVHDYNQHDTNPTLDKYIRKIVLYLSDKIIVLNKTTLDQLTSKDRVNIQKITTIPLGNYGTDKKYITKEVTNRFSFTFFGLIRKYKGVERLIMAFKKLEGKQLRLQIIGDCYDKNYFKYLKKLAVEDMRITLEDKYLSDKKLSIMVHESDVVVLPFIEVTNSSSAILSYSKGRPIIAPLIGPFKNHSKDIGFFYSDNTEQGLLEAMHLAIKNKTKLKKMGASAIQYAKLFDWSEIGLDTYNVYKGLFERK